MKQFSLGTTTTVCVLTSKIYSPIRAQFVALPSHHSRIAVCYPYRLSKSFTSYFKNHVILFVTNSTTIVLSAYINNVSCNYYSFPTISQRSCSCPCEPRYVNSAVLVCVCVSSVDIDFIKSHRQTASGICTTVATIFAVLCPNQGRSHLRH